jgi:UDP-N-acetylmuramyl pentapeptide phosphotransferase/UDP-N-acetylglucosamine-1-phosphate transferase
MLALLFSFAVAVAVSVLLVRFADVLHERVFDRDFTKPQKIHAVPAPRVGGIGIVLGLSAGGGAYAVTHSGDAAGFWGLLLLCAAPGFLTGLAHDLTEGWTPRGRLLATALSAGLAYYLMDAAIRVTHVPGLDWIVSFGPGALAVTVLAVTGIAHAMNIIDGLNGLASMCAAIMLGAVAYVAFQTGDTLVATIALAGIGAVLGFFVWNFPAGLIFLGDGGAYFLGFFVAELSILLLVRNPEVSPLFPLLVCIYPVFETLFSIYRRQFLRAVPPSLPDGIHLHSLIYRRLVRWAVGDRSAKALARRNSATSPVLWLLCMSSVVPAVLFWQHSGVIAGFLFVFALGYVALYWRIVRFRSPRWLRAMVTRPRPLEEQR